MRPTTLLPLTLFLGAPLLAQDSVAVYDVEFEATWSSTTHPGAYPAFAHFSSLVGGTHNAGVSFWQPGGIASPGMEAMAELGSTGPLQGEVGNAILNGTAATVVLGTPVPSSPGTANASFTVTEDHPLLTLVSMVAPSPDWFVGVYDFSLLVNGVWVDDVDVQLYAFDAGTDSGEFFNSANDDTQPQEPIALITTPPLGSSALPLGTFHITRRTSTLVYGSGLNPAGSLTVIGGLPTLGQMVQIGLADPSGTMLTPASTILAISDAKSVLFPSGFPINNVGLSMPGAQGEFLLWGNIVDQINGPDWNGSTVTIDVPVPNLAGLVGTEFYAQGLLIDGTPRIGLTDALELSIGP